MPRGSVDSSWTELTGAISDPFAAADPRIKAKAASALVRLPDTVGLTSLRELAPTMADLIGRHRLTVLSVEALAAAVLLDSDIAIAIGSKDPTLMQAASHELFAFISCRLDTSRHRR